MKREVRIDIIYFCTSADWGFESELYGDGYDLRLLTQTASTKSEAVRALSRAVGRSEMILLVGGFYGDICLPATVAAAIGFSCQRVGLAGARLEDTMILPVGAIPFALDGRLRGAALSSGPQTMIFLDEERDGRIRLVHEQVLPRILAQPLSDSLPAGAPAEKRETPPVASREAATPQKTVPPVQDATAVAKEISEEAAADRPAEKPASQPDTLPDKPEGAAPSSAPVKKPEELSSGRVPEPIPSERVVLTSHRPEKAGSVDADPVHIPKAEALSPSEKEILKGLPRLRLSAEHRAKVDKLPENLRLPAQEPETLPHEHIELKNIRLPSASVPKREAAPLIHLPGGAVKKQSARAETLPLVELEKMELSPAEQPKPGDWVTPSAPAPATASPAAEESESLHIGRAGKIVIAVIVILLLALALWSGYSYFASDSEPAAAAAWIAEAEGVGGRIW